MYNLTSCGDNCAKWILELAKDRDITMRLGHYMQFEECEPFKIEVLNTNKVVTNRYELVQALLETDDK
jgi:hypothetical protein